MDSFLYKCSKGDQEKRENEREKWQVENAVGARSQFKLPRFTAPPIPETTTEPLLSFMPAIHTAYNYSFMTNAPGIREDPARDTTWWSQQTLGESDHIKHLVGPSCFGAPRIGSTEPASWTWASKG